MLAVILFASNEDLVELCLESEERAYFDCLPSIDHWLDTCRKCPCPVLDKRARKVIVHVVKDSLLLDADYRITAEETRVAFFLAKLKNDCCSNVRSYTPPELADERQPLSLERLMGPSIFQQSPTAAQYLQLGKRDALGNARELRYSRAESSSGTESSSDGENIEPVSSPKSLSKQRPATESFIQVSGDQKPVVQTMERPIPVSKVYKCFSPDCSGNSKTWKGGREFWNHIKGRHPEEDAHGLVTLYVLCSSTSEDDY